MLFEPCQRVTVVRQFFGGGCESCSSMFSCGVSSGTSEFVVGYGFFHRKRVVGLKMESDIFTGFFGKWFVLYSSVGIDFQLNVKDRQVTVVVW